MRKIDSITTTTYKAGFEDFYIDVVTDTQRETFGAYIYRERNGLHLFMFGVPFEQSNGERESLEGFLELLESNIEEYSEYYDEENELSEWAFYKQMEAEKQGLSVWDL